MEHADLGALRRVLPSTAPPVRPWTYVRMRRLAAGLTVDQAAACLAFAHPLGLSTDAIRYIRTLETPGIRCRHGARELKRAFPFNSTVYVVLSEREAASGHPTLCERCGWDVWTEQPDLLGYSTRWSDGAARICTRCEQIERGETY